jgi:hypothetical protein
MMWIIIGGIGMFLGFILSLTGIGLICGLPIIIGSLPIMIYGGYKYRQHQLNQLKESIRSGIVEGSQVQQAKTLCPACGASNLSGNRFCASCGGPLSVEEPWPKT